MKKLLIICIGLLVLLQPAIAQIISEEDKQLRDSIFHVFHTTTENDSSRVKLMRRMFQANIGKGWAVEILDSALNVAVKSSYAKGEISIYYDYYRQSKYQRDSLKMNQALENLGRIADKYKSYEWYFVAWADILDFSNARGDTEHTIIEAHRMGERARKVQDARGMVLARIAEARALSAAHRRDEALQLFSESLEMKGLSKIDRMHLFSSIASIYEDKKAYDKAILYLKMEAAEMQQLLKEKKGREDIYNDNLLSLEIRFCELYIAIGDAQNIYKHLKRAEKYNKPNNMFTLKYSYLLGWAEYYHLTKQWDECFRNFDDAIALIGNVQPFYRLSVRGMKAQALMDAGRFEEAARTHCLAAMELDSLNHDIRRRHQEIHQANYDIRQALLMNETVEVYYNMLRTGGVILLAGIIFGLLLRAFYVHRMLKHSECETQKALNDVKAADKMKEVFLHNITHEIRTPLNAVVGFSELLTTDKELTQEEKEQYATLIKYNAGWLTKLVFDILDLSRLESGMMKFEVQECDVVQLCRDAKMLVEMQNGNSAYIEFETALDSLSIQADSGRFMKLLQSALSPMRENAGLSLVKYSLEVEDVQLKITISGSPLLEHVDDEEGRSLPNRIQHDINRIYLTIFKGGYRIEKVDGKQLIIITYPI